MFNIPGIIGPDKKKDAYPSIQDFIKQTHEGKDGELESLIKLMDSKLTALK